MTLPTSPAPALVSPPRDARHGRATGHVITNSLGYLQPLQPQFERPVSRPLNASEQAILRQILRARKKLEELAKESTRETELGMRRDPRR